MKLKIISTIILFTSILSAQWFNNQSMNSQRYSLRKISAVDPQHTWAAGDSGVIVFSSDQGRSWTAQNSGVKTMLNGILFLDTSNGFAYGAKGGMIATTNGGGVWQKVFADDTTISIRAMSFCDKKNGWLFSVPGNGIVPLVYRTRNGGALWSKDTMASKFGASTKIQFTDSLNGWFLSPKNIRHTTDGGKTWNVFDNGGNIYTTFRDLHFFNANSGYFLMDQYLRVYFGRTSNGGETWSIDSSISSASGTTYSIHFIDSLHGSCLASGSVGVTTNAGVSWKLFKRYGMSAVSTIDSTTTLVVGTNGLKLYSNDRGATWIDLTPPSPVTLTKVKYQTANNVWAIGWSSTLLLSTDQGTNWRKVNIASGIGFSGMTFPDSVNGWILDDSARIFHTVDLGKNFTIQSTGMNGGLKSIFFTDSLFGCTVGNSGKILRTTNGGSSWSAAVQPTSQHLYDVFFLDRERGWAVGEGGTIIRSSQSGTAWSGQSSPVVTALRSVSFSDSLHGIIVGDLGVVLRTTDGGTTWTQQPMQNALNYRAAKMIGSNGWFVGDSGSIYTTPNFGSTWYRQPGKTTAALNGIDFVNSNIGSIVGEGMIVLITKSGGNTAVNERSSAEQPRSFELLNNYPNPFNPSTTIRFELQHRSDVHLIVYDMLGKKVALLVNEERNAGEHSVTWDASAIAAGMYFARMSAGNFTAVKKLVLLK